MRTQYILQHDEKYVIDLEETKEIELDILLKFKAICEKYDIAYSLAYGTLLGAVRHNGFIPWDDDIDVMMQRKDYYRFLDVAKTELSESKYEIASMHNESNYFAPLAKMYDKTTRVYQLYGQKENVQIGLYIDIFILDELPTVGAEQFYEEAQKLREKWALSARDIFSKHKSKNIIRDYLGNLVSLPFRIKGINYYRDKYDRFCASYNNMGNNEIAVIAYGEGLEKEKMTVDRMKESTTVIFEGYSFRAVNSPELYLRSMYGNYMMLPPVKNRVSKHSNIKVKLR